MGHNYKFISTFPFSTLYKIGKQETVINKPITIQDGVWIGSNVIILGGITVGTGAVIGAGSVVTKDVAAYSIVAGNPAREIKKRFNDSQIEKLLKLNPYKNIDSINTEDLLSEDIASFLTKYQQLLKRK